MSGRASIIQTKPGFNRKHRNEHDQPGSEVEQMPLILYACLGLAPDTDREHTVGVKSQ